MPDISGLARFIGIGGDGSKFQLGTGTELANLANIDPEFLGKIREAQQVKFSETNPTAALEEERRASELDASANVYTARLRSAQKKSGAFVKAIVAKINHGVVLEN